MKVTVVGAGLVGATCADSIAHKDIVQEVVLLDVKENLAEGKALDMWQQSPIDQFDTRVHGSTNDFSKTAGSDIVVITAGVPRKPGMSRDDLISINADIVKTSTENILKYSPDAIIIIVSNPMDTMTYLALQATGLPKNRVIGMGGALDSARFKYQLSQHLGASPSDLNAVVIGGHGDTTMIPLIRFATWNSVPVTKFLSEDQQKQIVADTMVGGATLTKLLGTSAWYAPGAAGCSVVKSIVRDEKKLITSCVLLDGEYGQKDIALGVPVIIGRNGVEKILDFGLNAEEQAAFDKSAEAVRSMNDVLKTL